MAEKAVVKSKNRFLKLLPKAAASAVTFQTLPFSPSKEKRSSDKLQKSHKGKGSSGAPMISIIPANALHSKSRNSSFAVREPTSPKISCMGQVKHKKKLCSSLINNNNYVLPPLDHVNRMVQNHNKSSLHSDKEENSPAHKSVESFGDVKKKKKPLAIKNMFSRVPSGRRKSHDATADYGGDHRPSSCSLSQMRRFSSGRSSLSNFDWTAAQVEPVYNEGENGCRERVKISVCAPRIIQECKAVSLEPKKEINLWKRRTMAQPSPLQLKTS